MRTIAPKEALTAKAQRSEPPAKNSQAAAATPEGRRPEATGLNFFTGCRRSCFLSMRSFNMYTLPDVRQKIKKPSKAGTESLRLKRLEEKMRAASRSKFFVHCLGLKLSITAASILISSLLPISLNIPRWSRSRNEPEALSKRLLPRRPFRPVKFPPGRSRL